MICRKPKSLQIGTSKSWYIVVQHYHWGRLLSDKSNVVKLVKLSFQGLLEYDHEDHSLKGQVDVIKDAGNDQHFQVQVLITCS